MNEGSRYLKDHPELDLVDALMVDINGIIRGKRMGPNNLAKIYDKGFQMPASTILLDITGDDLNPMGISVSKGDPDITAMPIKGTLHPIPWSKKQAAQCLVSLYHLDGRPYPFDPRHVLSNVIARFEELGLRPVVAIEQEFYLLDRQGARDGMPQPPLVPGSGRRGSTRQVLSIQDIDAFGDFLDDVTTACKAQNIPVGPISAEFAPSQFEINLVHTDDLLNAADQAVLMPRIVKSVAQAHGFDATFMAKPYPEESGSGMHIHVSLLDKGGNNVFADGTDTGSDLLRQSIAGVLATMHEAMAIFAPNLNSFRRFEPDIYVPINRSWGINNRSVAVRIPVGDDAAKRLETRVAGADANPYLSLAATLAGIHHGLTNKLTPPEISTGNACTVEDPGLPLRWETALDAMAGADILPEYLGAEFCQTYVTCKRIEIESFHSTASKKEYEWYLRPDY